MSNNSWDDDQKQGETPSLKEQLETYKLAKDLGLLEEEETGSGTSPTETPEPQDQGDDDVIEIVNTGSIKALAPSKSATDAELRKRAQAGDSSAGTELMRRSRERAHWNF
jgi:hypothetical protein